MADLSRRRFLKALGWSAAGITAVAGGATFALMPVLPPRNRSTLADAAVWISLRHGPVRCAPKQGERTQVPGHSGAGRACRRSGRPHPRR